MAKLLDGAANDPMAYFHAGTFESDYGFALRYYTRVLELDPSFATAYLERARIHPDWDKKDLAKADLEKVIQLSKDELLVKTANNSLTGACQIWHSPCAMSELRQLIWVGSSREDLKRFPEDVQDAIGYALFVVQLGDTPECAKPFKIGKGGAAGVMEIVEDFDTDTYRAVYTVRFRDVVYVLHCFQKKSRHGIQTPKRDVELVRSRLHRAEEDYRLWKGRRS